MNLNKFSLEELIRIMKVNIKVLQSDAKRIKCKYLPHILRKHKTTPPEVQRLYNTCFFLLSCVLPHLDAFL